MARKRDASDSEFEESYAEVVKKPRKPSTSKTPVRTSSETGKSKDVKGGKDGKEVKPRVVKDTESKSSKEKKGGSKTVIPEYIQDEESLNEREVRQKQAFQSGVIRSSCQEGEALPRVYKKHTSKDILSQLGRNKQDIWVFPGKQKAVAAGSRIGYVKNVTTCNPVLYQTFPNNGEKGACLRLKGCVVENTLPTCLVQEKSHGLVVKGFKTRKIVFSQYDWVPSLEEIKEDSFNEVPMANPPAHVLDKPTVFSKIEHINHSSRTAPSMDDMDEDSPTEVEDIEELEESGEENNSGEENGSENSENEDTEVQSEESAYSED